jgi:hypothetical protein
LWLLPVQASRSGRQGSRASWLHACDSGQRHAARIAAGACGDATPDRVHFSAQDAAIKSTLFHLPTRLVAVVVKSGVTSALGWYFVLQWPQA